MRRSILAGIVGVLLVLAAVPAWARGTTVYRSAELRITELMGPGEVTWTFRNRTNEQERVTCRWGFTVLLTSGETVQDHMRWTTTLDGHGNDTRSLGYGDGVVHIRSSSWRCRVR
jgi:hypothetical protein